MKRFSIFALAAIFFAACATDQTTDVQPVDAPETLTVSFEEETRIQLNEAQKTVWTEGDLVSVFYRSNANQKWQYQGETGERKGDLKRISAGSATETMQRVVVVYPYNDSYYLNTETYNVEATLPATQHYLKDSYGLDGNLMISSGEYNQFSLKNVCGWLKLQLTGNGEVVKSITLKGNNGEQVAGQIYVNSADATATLASEMGAADDNENSAGGNLVFEDTIIKEVTLDCGEGVTLGEEATAFYIALPPQTFEKGLTIEVACSDGSTMTKSTENSIAIERNAIQPMTSVAYNGIFKPANNEIWYTNGSTTQKTTPRETNAFGANIVSNLYDEEKKCWVITFDGDVTEIGEGAFYNCTSLTSVTIPDSVTEIGERAFLYCTSLKAFYGKFASEDNRCLIVDGTLHSFAPAGITSYTIPNSVTKIGDYAFYDCNSLISIIIPDSVTKIGYMAFDRCTSLTSVNIPDSVTEIGSGAFCFCTSLKAFYGKFATTDNRCLIINGTLNAFAIGCGATSYTIPNSVTKIGNYAFESCTSLTSVTIPDSITEIGYEAFWNCESLTSVTIPDSVTSIGRDVFGKCTSLTSITIPDSVTKIGEWVFYSCTSLKTVYCKPTTPPTGGHDMFSYYNNNSYVPIGCKIYVPASDDDSIINAYKAAQYWSDYADYIFEEVEPTPANNEIWYTNGSTTKATTPYDTSVFGANIVSNLYDADKECWVIKFDGNVTKIGSYAFYYYSSLTSITIPDSVTEIGERAFYYCTSLTSVTIPNSVTSIGEMAFYYCKSLTAFYGKFASEDNRCLIVNGTLNAFASGCGATSYTIPNGVTSIGEYAFYDCDSLTSVTIPDSITEIEGHTFQNCSNLTSVTIGNGVTEIGCYAFDYCTELTNIIIPDSINSIREYAFSFCSKLTNITIPNSVATIGYGLFEYCSSLTSVIIGKGVTEIGSGAFSYCTSLKEVYCKPTTPPTGGQYMFGNNASGRRIFVPASADHSILNAYKAAAGWSTYKSYIEEYDFSAEQ